jgi:hypothetical protein
LEPQVWAAVEEKLAEQARPGSTPSRPTMGSRGSPAGRDRCRSTSMLHD